MGDGGGWQSASPNASRASPTAGRASPATSEASSKPSFLQPAYDLGVPASRRPPRPPQDPDHALPEKAGGARSSPDPLRPSTPLSSRASSPLQRRLAGASPNPTATTPRGSSSPRGASSTGAPSSSGSCGFGGLGGTGSLAGSLSRPGTGASRSGGDAADGEAAKRQEMLQQGYLPTQEYVGIMALNKELREQNKRLHAELVTIRVEHERLRMEEGFLRGNALKAGLKPPPEVAALSSGNEEPGALTDA
eukprot:CAMPEP_0179171772 /NCGR_PEP_ID=MMETSP0796-20121207/84688_1 /TAXON_ID=73915 /ORGANISM="Pyrodinium bahamense, Strain pbaha01" /LENGTH=248 /DNA_ID=CAMNT_0020874865 /DNA_START=71 /DNA_END=814 /DNA_ORIENTATION=+